MRGTASTTREAAGWTDDDRWTRERCETGCGACEREEGVDARAERRTSTRRRRDETTTRRRETTTRRREGGREGGDELG